MKPTHFWQVTERLEEQLEDKDFAVNITLLGGAELREYQVVVGLGSTPGPGQPMPLVELAKEDRPPIYVDIEHIASVELANRGGF
jgi:hypothetical protein